ncbi:hypothetical protein HC776_01030 [bacterium]|nr:hypothetical protein [bacterium]
MLLKSKKEKRSSGLLQGEVMSWRAAWRGLAATLFLSGLVFADQIYFRAAGNNGVVTTAILLRSLGVGGFTLVVGLLIWSIMFRVSWWRKGMSGKRAKRAFWRFRRRVCCGCKTPLRWRLMMCKKRAQFSISATRKRRKLVSLLLAKYRKECYTHSDAA